MVRALLLAALCSITPALGAEIDPDALAKAIEKGREWLKPLQRADGGFDLPPAPDGTLETNFPQGYSALATLTLLKTGTPPDDPSIERAFQYIYSLPLKKTYEVSLVILCIEARYVPPPELLQKKEDQGYTSVARGFFRGKARKQDLAKLQECVDWLIAHQSKQIGAGWRYPQGEIDQDNSCTQYAMLALKGARRLGANVPLAVFEKVADFLVAQQDATGPEVPWFAVPAADGPIYEMLTIDQRQKKLDKERKEAEKEAAKEAARRQKEAEKDGTRVREQEGPETPLETLVRPRLTARGWSYLPRPVEDAPPPESRVGPVPARTVSEQNTTGSMTCSGVAALCIAKSELENTPGSWRPRQQAVEQAIRDGCAWLAHFFNPKENPSSGDKKTVGWKYYWFYSTERAGVLAGTYQFGEHDWWDEIAEHVLTQQNAEGSWPDAKGLSRLSRTCFALLFLSRSTVPLVPFPKKRVMTGGK